MKLVNKTSGRSWDNPLELFLALNDLGSRHGIGRIDIVENRFIGIKSRGVYETPGGTILREAHMDIEGIAMDREVMRLRDSLVTKILRVDLHGFWFSPEMEFLQAALDKSQEAIDGSVTLRLYRGRAMVIGRESPSSLYDRDLVSMDIEGGFNPLDSEGFIKINAIRLRAHHAIMARPRKGDCRALIPQLWRRVPNRPAIVATRYAFVRGRRVGRAALLRSGGPDRLAGGALARCTRPCGSAARPVPPVR